MTEVQVYFSLPFCMPEQDDFFNCFSHPYAHGCSSDPVNKWKGDRPIRILLMCEIFFKKITCNFWKVTIAWEKRSIGSSRFNKSKAVLQIAFLFSRILNKLGKLPL